MRVLNHYRLEAGRLSKVLRNYVKERLQWTGVEKGQAAFWSVTMHDGKTELLIKNPINRYLINSPMLPGLKKNADGSLRLCCRG